MSHATRETGEKWSSEREGQKGSVGGFGEWENGTKAKVEVQ